jgi:hypothetical protein
MLALAALVVLQQLAAAHISIEIAAATAQVEVRFDITQPGDSLRVSLIRLPGQTLELVSQDGSNAGVGRNQDAGLTWVTAAVTEGSARLRYRVSGSLSRIPIAVPDVPAEPGAGAVTVKVTGLDATARFHEGFPRLMARPDGSAIARLDNVPSFVRQPPPRFAWSVNRAAQVFVIVLVAGASTAWAVRGRRRTATRHS